MMVIRQRLFWKIYLTLLTSLVAAALLMGALWWLLGEAPRESWGALRLSQADTTRIAQASGAALAPDIARLAEDVGGDVSLYDPDGVLIAARGPPIPRVAGRNEADRWPHLSMRIELAGGRLLLVRLAPPPGRRALGVLTAMLIAAGGVGLAAFPVTARLTRRLEALRAGMARWGEGDLATRVDGGGSDEVASLARTFNAAAERIILLLNAQRALLANASHELRSPLARLRMAVDLWQTRPDPSGREEIVRNLVELDGLVDEILLSSRLEHPGATAGRLENVDLLGLAAEEAVRAGALFEGEPVEIEGNERLLRRLIRNLLENGVKHGLPPVRILVRRSGDKASVIVSDAGDGIPAPERDRVFEPFYRPAGRGEGGGGWGLGLSLVRQIVARHAGLVTCEEADGASGSRFVVILPLRQTPAADGGVQALTAGHSNRRDSAALVR